MESGVLLIGFQVAYCRLYLGEDINPFSLFRSRLRCYCQLSTNKAQSNRLRVITIWIQELGINIRTIRGAFLYNIIPKLQCMLMQTWDTIGLCFGAWASNKGYKHDRYIFSSLIAIYLLGWFDAFVEAFPTRWQSPVQGHPSWIGMSSYLCPAVMPKDSTPPCLQ